MMILMKVDIDPASCQVAKLELFKRIYGLLQDKLSILGLDEHAALYHSTNVDRFGQSWIDKLNRLFSFASINDKVG